MLNQVYIKKKDREKKLRPNYKTEKENEITYQKSLYPKK